MAARKPAAGPLSAYVLHSWDWSETSLIVELYTRERGRLVVAAKGAKRPTSQLRPVLLPFQRLAVQLGRAGEADEATEIHPLRSAEWAGGATMPNGAALFAGFYVNELIMKLTARQDPQASLFDAYAAALDALSSPAAGGGGQLVLRAFEVRLLRELGVLPDLSAVTLTLEAVHPQAAYTLHPESGVIASPGAEGALAGALLAPIEAALEGGDFAALMEAARPAAQRLRGLLRHLVQYHLGSPTMRTRQVMAGVLKLSEPGKPRR